MLYVILFYAAVSALLFVSYKNWSGIKRIEKNSIYSDAFIKQNERHLELMEQQLKNADHQVRAGALMGSQLAHMNEKMEYIKRESIAMREDITYIKSVVLEDTQPENTNLDFLAVESMNHEIVVTEESEAEKA